MTLMDRPGPLSNRGILLCRACGAEGLASVLDLGTQPLANELVTAADAPCATFPLHLRSCSKCGLGQVGEFVLPERIFGDYPYLSSVSTSWLAHAKSYAEYMDKELNLTSEHCVVEIGSNDGYLLKRFHHLGVQVLGVEPAANVAALAESAGVTTLNDFFGRETAERILQDHEHPRLIVANNVMAHVPDLGDFVEGLSLLCGASTVVTVENPSYVALLRDTQFDTIYHEHYSYLSAHAIYRLAVRHGLELIRVQHLTTHGGSYRYWLARSGTRAVDPSVAATIDGELAQGLLSPQAWRDFADRSYSTIRILRGWLDERAASDARVVGYGAAAKGNTLLNAAGATASDLIGVVDGSSEKQGKWLPGSRVPIIEPAALVELTPSDVLVLPWNLASEIVPLVNHLVPRARCWAAIPTIRPLGS